jgi:small subunit ribosomal protein S20
VAHSLSAKKRIRQNIKRRARNRARKEVLKTQVKSFLTALGSGDLKKATEELRSTVRRLDKVAAKRTIHRNAASRKRSRLQRRLNALAAAGVSTGSPAGGKTAGAGRATAAKRAPKSQTKTS